MNTVRLLSLKLVNSLRDDGITKSLAKAIRYLRHGRLMDEFFDLRHGTDTSGDPSKVGFGDRYQPTTESELRAAVEYLGVSHGRFKFIDLGCGKGRTLLVAAQLGFKEVIGVELQREFAEAAMTNLVKLQIMNGTVLHTNAADYQFPAGDLVLYLFNPFMEEVMSKVIENLKGSSRRPNDEIYLIYKLPWLAAMLDETGFLGQIGGPPAFNDIRIWKVKSSSL